MPFIPDDEQPNSQPTAGPTPGFVPDDNPIVNQYNSAPIEEQDAIIKIIGDQVEEKRGAFDRFADFTGGALKKASNFTFGSTAKTVGGMISNTIGDVAQLYGQASGNEKAAKFGQRMEQKAGVKENLSPTNIAFTALELYPGGGYVSKYLKQLPGGAKLAEVISKIPDALKKSAISQYAKALGATKEEFKQLTQKVAPEMIERGIKFSNAGELAAKATSEASTAGTAIRNYEETIPETAKSKVKPVVEKLTELRNKYFIEGKNVNPSAVKAIDEVANRVTQFGENISQKSLIRFRRILDESVAAGKGFMKDKITNMSDKAEKAAADVIRGILAADDPKLAELYKEYSFWKSIKDISTATVKRQTGQSGGVSKLVTSAAAGSAGFASGDTLEQRLSRGALGIFLGKNAISLLKSPGFKTRYANYVTELADLIATGKFEQIEVLAGKLLGGVKNTFSNQKSNKEIELLPIVGEDETQ